MTTANVSSACATSTTGDPPAEATTTAFTVSAATANIVTSVTPMTTPIAMRLDRSG